MLSSGKNQHNLVHVVWKNESFTEMCSCCVSCSTFHVFATGKCVYLCNASLTLNMITAEKIYLLWNLHTAMLTEMYSSTLLASQTKFSLFSLFLSLMKNWLLKYIYFFLITYWLFFERLNWGEYFSIPKACLFIFFNFHFPICNNEVKKLHFVLSVYLILSVFYVLPKYSFFATHRSHNDFLLLLSLYKVLKLRVFFLNKCVYR